MHSISTLSVIINISALFRKEEEDYNVLRNQSIVTCEEYPLQARVEEVLYL